MSVSESAITGGLASPDRAVPAHSSSNRRATDRKNCTFYTDVVLKPSRDSLGH
jgi:hypothetical protein